MLTQQCFGMTDQGFDSSDHRCKSCGGCQTKIIVLHSRRDVAKCEVRVAVRISFHSPLFLLRGRSKGDRERGDQISSSL